MNTQLGDHPESSVPSQVMVAGKAASSPLRDDKALSKQVVQHFVHSVAPCATLPSEELRGEVAEVVNVCIHLLALTLDGAGGQGELARLRRASAQWAREGIPLHLIHHAIYEGVKVTVGQHAGTVAGADGAVLREIGGRLVELMGTVVATMADAYITELRVIAGEHHSARHTLLAGLLAGRPTSVMARECGITIADAYFVVALSIPPLSGKGSAPERRVLPIGRRTLATLQRMLDDRPDGTLSLLGPDHSTVLIPTQFGDRNLDGLIRHLSAMAGVQLTATVVHAAAAGIPDAHQQAHELLAFALHARRGRPGLYRFADLAVEYQLSRRGPGHNSLSALLGPLDERPELLQTLTTYFQFDFNPKRAARALHVHPNTLTNRLKRIADLVGVDPSNPRGAWRLHSALLARETSNLHAPRYAPPPTPHQADALP